MLDKRSFPSKILLFGEYSVIKHSNALAMPYPLFEGKLRFRQSDVRKDAEMRALSRYLDKLDDRGDLPFEFDIASFSFDVGQGLIFESSIPHGYGVGSSGALCSAIYDRYTSSDVKLNSTLEDVRQHLALIESHFHGSSSGLDPLVSFTGKAILKEHGKGFHTVTLPQPPKNEYALFLLDTGRSRKTEPLVNLFLEKCKNEEYSRFCEDTLAPLTDSCIQDYLNGDRASLWNHFAELSHLQHEHFHPMIPKLYQDLWEQGLKEKDFSLKLCGAGGGGFLLGMAKDFKKCSRLLKDFGLRPL